MKESRRVNEGVGASRSDWEKPPYGYHEDKVKYYTDSDTDNVGMLLSPDENGNYSVLILDGDGEELGGISYDAVADNLTDLKDAERCAVKLSIIISTIEVNTISMREMYEGKRD